jgi:hypothetical protein
MKILLILFLAMLLFLPLSAGYLLFTAIGDRPHVDKPAAVANSQNAERVRNLVRNYRSNETEELSITGQDLESIIAFGVRGVPSARADAQINEQGLEARLTITLPANPVGRYLNLGFNIPPSEQGMAIKQITLGETVISAGLLAPAAGWLFDFLLGEGSGESFAGMVQKVRFGEDKMLLTMAPGQVNTREMTGKLDKLFDRIKDSEQLRIADPEIVQLYFNQLRETAASVRGGYVPLTRYIRPVFEMAASRSISGGAQVVTENQAAIMALAIYFGDSRMQKLVERSHEELFPKTRLGSHNVTLKGRHDLVQHYLTSAGLQLAAGAGVANAIGEFKEIADTLRGGSGFSFSDIAGDKAGVTLAVQASEPASAQRLQAAMARVENETDFFPDITGLPDNMTQAEFERRYGNVESQRYQEVLADIERRIALVPAFGEGR